MNSKINRIKMRLEYQFCEYFPCFAIVSLALIMVGSIGLMIMAVL